MKQTLSSQIESRLTQDKPLLLEFYADWCPHCRRMKPVVDELVREVGDRASVIRVNIDEYPDITAEYDVDTYPTWIIFRDRRLATRFTGETTLDTLLEKLM